MDYDESRIYYSYQNLQTNPNGRNDDTNNNEENEIEDLDLDNVNLHAAKRHFREFLRNYRQKQRYLYRDRLLRMHQRTSGDDYTTPQQYSSTEKENNQQQNQANANSANIEVNLAHIGEYDSALLDLLLRQPTTALPPFETAAAEALKSLLYEKRQHDNLDLDDNDDNENNPAMQQEQGTTQNSQNPQQQDPDNPIDATTNNQRPAASTFHGSSVQILLRGNLKPTPIRHIQSSHMNTLIRCTGIVISSSKVRSRATYIAMRCNRCQNSHTSHATSGPFGAVALPQRCMGPNPTECGPAPYSVVPDECAFVDQQTLKLQEAPEAVPTGEMPRSVLLAVERGLVDRSPPGSRVSVWTVVSLFSAGGGFGGSSGSTSVKTVYLRVIGMQKDSGSGDHVTFTPREEEAFRLLARRSDVYHILSRSMAPSISGSYTVDIKKALTCQLFSGSRKHLPDGMRLRGDINVLLLGDPSMAKSQFLKYATRVAPVGVYTSGKGSSAAGLTASVVRDQRGEFYLEGGAMVLADGGVVAIDEFDKMRPADRVAIHEAMEQQTISVAKAGITTVLNSRSSVLAAANPVFGRYDDTKSASDNIDLMTTILSRFDLIFLVRDVRDEELDKMICHHVMGVHINNSRGSGGAGTGFGSGANGPEFGEPGQDNGDSGAPSNNTPEAISNNAMQVASTGIGELDVPTMKKYIQYCKAKCSPRLSQDTGDVLASSYVKIRDDVRRTMMESASNSRDDNENGGYGKNDDQSAVPITVRQLEALIRISESLAKMRLEDEVQGEDIAEALRLFKVSTMAANATDKNSAAAAASHAGGGQRNHMMLAAAPSREEMQRTESFLRSRLAIGTVVNKQRIVEEAASQGYDASVVARVIAVMVMRGEVQERNRGRLFKRLK